MGFKGVKSCFGGTTDFLFLRRNFWGILADQCSVIMDFNGMVDASQA